jgi:5-methylcytosine-specific restriction endonuclease McrA
VQFTVSSETHDKLRRVQDLLRHTIPDGDPAAIFDHALTLLLAELSRTKLAATDRPRTNGAIAPRHSRHIPSAVKRNVWTRDGGQCAFRGERGRCAETGFLEFHHVVPYADGGESSVANLELRCRAHNQYEADLWSGRALPLTAREGRTLFGA